MRSCFPTQSQWALNQGFLGGMIWSIEEDDFSNRCGGGSFPLLSEIYRIITTGSPSTGDPGTQPTSSSGTTQVTSTGDPGTQPTSSPGITVVTSTGDPGTQPTASSGTTKVTTVNPVTSSTGNPSAEKFVVCYHGAWSRYRVGEGHFEPNDIDPFLCTHVIYAFAKLEESTSEIASSDPWLDFPSSHPGGRYDGYGEFVNLKQTNPNLKAMLAIGGWNEGSVKYSEMAADPAKRATFVASAVKFVKEYNFDGLDLDWEYPANRGGSPDDKENFAKLVTELKTVSHF